MLCFQSNFDSHVTILPPLGKLSKWPWLYPFSTPYFTSSHPLPKRDCLLTVPHWHRTGHRVDVSLAAPWARSGEGPSAPSCQAPQGHDQTLTDVQFSSFFDWRPLQVNILATCDSSVGTVISGRLLDLRPLQVGGKKQNKNKCPTIWSWLRDAQQLGAEAPSLPAHLIHSSNSLVCIFSVTLYLWHV